MKKALRWIALAAGAIIVFIIAIFTGREEGKGEGEIEQKSKDEIAKVKDAAKRGDTDAIDDEWRKP
jgi:3-dehydroquinate dehydratase